MNAQAWTKARAHTEHLLDLLLGLRHKLSLLYPLLPGESVARQASSGPSSEALAVLRFALFSSCLQDLVKATLDEDRRAPSVVNILPVLEDPTCYQAIREDFSVRYLAHDEVDPELRTALEALGQEEAYDRRTQFDKLADRLHADWAHLESTAQLQACKTIRDKLVAHTELQYMDGTYRLLDVAALGLRWTDLGPLTAQLETIVVALNLLLRRASFDFEGLDRNLKASQLAFWHPATER